jgi:hypothetical protein
MAWYVADLHYFRLDDVIDVTHLFVDGLLSACRQRDCAADREETKGNKPEPPLRPRP